MGGAASRRDFGDATSAREKKKARQQGASVNYHDQGGSPNNQEAGKKTDAGENYISGNTRRRKNEGITESPSSKNKKAWGRGGKKELGPGRNK